MYVEGTLDTNGEEGEKRVGGDRKHLLGASSDTKDACKLPALMATA